MNIGKLKAIIDRELSYVSKFNFVMIGYLFFKEVEFHLWYLSVIPVYLIWVYIDLKYIMPQEYNYIHSKSPFLKKLFL